MRRALLVLPLLVQGCATPDAGVVPDEVSTPAQVAQVAPVAPTEDGPRAGYFPNYVLTTHEGREVRFYDDLVRGRLVVLSFLYTQCDGV